MPSKSQSTKLRWRYKLSREKGGIGNDSHHRHCDEDRDCGMLTGSRRL